jgi:aminoglycoside phosphotransferase (APT) family kinase protein
VAGFNPTNPTFIFGDVVVKLFGFIPSWQTSHEAELAAQTLVSTDPEIAAPHLIAKGQLYDPNTPWSYLVTTRIPGAAWLHAQLSTAQKLSLAAEMGRQVNRIHALRPSGIATHENWAALNVVEAAERSSLPPHLVVQIDDYLTTLAPFDPVFVHGDLVSAHAFIENGRLTGIIDWGDAMVADPHYEIIQIYRDMFNCDKSLLRVFLEASDWPVTRDFPRQAMGHALYRQAVGLAQHTTMDVFEPIAVLLSLQDIATLDDLAAELFAV